MRSLLTKMAVLSAAALAMGVLGTGAARADAPIEVRVVVITTFQINTTNGSFGADSGPNTIGEFQNWVQKLPLPDTFDFPQGYHHLRYNAQKHVLGIETGEGPVHAASSITALGHDPRFDLSHAYFVVAAIAGVDPKAASVGSAAWASYVVDADLAYEIDAREIPSDWSTGYVPLNRYRPYQTPVPPANSPAGDQVFQLNSGLVRWAYNLTKDVLLPDDATLQTVRAKYTAFPNALKPPFVLIGDDLSGGTFWTGTLLTQWAEGWVNYWTHGKGKFVMTAEEDAGIMQALTFLSHAGLVDLKRVLVLRTASDYSLPPPDQTAAQFLQGEATATALSGFSESLNAAYAVGSKVVDAISSNWGVYRDTLPQ